MHKPPVAPKPTLAQLQRPGLSPSPPRRNGLPLPSPGTPGRVKPALAPKPCLSKVTPAVVSRSLASKSLDQTPTTETQRTEGLLNSQKGIQQEKKKPDWDYIIPICLCSHKNCICIRNTHLNTLHKGTSRTEENGKLLPTSQGAVDNSGETTILVSTTRPNLEPLQEAFTVDRNLNTDVPVVTVRPGPHRTWSDEANGNVIPQSAPGRGPEEDALGSERTTFVFQPKPVSTGPRKPVPVPVPRNPRMAVLTRQEKVEEEKEEIISQMGKDTDVKEVEMSLGGKGNTSLSVSVPGEKLISLSARKTCAAPAPPLRKKPFLSAPKKALTSTPQALPKDVEEEDLGWDSSSHEMEVSLDKEDEVVEKEKEETRDQEAVYTDFTRSPPFGSPQPELSLPPAITVPAEDLLSKMAQKTPRRNSSPTAQKQSSESSEEKEDEKIVEMAKTKTLEDCALKKRLMKELPLPPAEKTSRSFPTPTAIKPSRPSLGKQRAKSFSGADLQRSEGQKRNSFRKLLDFKLAMKMFPKLTVKGGQSPDSAANDNEQSVDGNQDRCQNFHEHLRSDSKFPCPLIGVEQSVDGDEFYYENIPYYEEIPDYFNVHVGTALASSLAFMQPTAWQNLVYNDEGIYEEQEPYVSFEKNTECQQCQTPTDCER